jgi:hypothetical protein
MGEVHTQFEMEASRWGWRVAKAETTNNGTGGSDEAKAGVGAGRPAGSVDVRPVTHVSAAGGRYSILPVHNRALFAALAYDARSGKENFLIETISADDGEFVNMFVDIDGKHLPPDVLAAVEGDWAAVLSGIWAGALPFIPACYRGTCTMQVSSTVTRMLSAYASPSKGEEDEEVDADIDNGAAPASASPAQAPGVHIVFNGFPVTRTMAHTIAVAIITRLSEDPTVPGRADDWDETIDLVVYNKPGGGVLRMLYQSKMDWKTKTSIRRIYYPRGHFVPPAQAQAGDQNDQPPPPSPPVLSWASVAPPAPLLARPGYMVEAGAEEEANLRLSSIILVRGTFAGSKRTYDDARAVGVPLGHGDVRANCVFLRGEAKRLRSSDYVTADSGDGQFAAIFDLVFDALVALARKDQGEGRAFDTTLLAADGALLPNARADFQPRVRFPAVNKRKIDIFTNVKWCRNQGAFHVRVTARFTLDDKGGLWQYCQCNHENAESAVSFKPPAPSSGSGSASAKPRKAAARVRCSKYAKRCGFSRDFTSAFRTLVWGTKRDRYAARVDEARTARDQVMASLAAALKSGGPPRPITVEERRVMDEYKSRCDTFATLFPARGAA